MEKEKFDNTVIANIKITDGPKIISYLKSKGVDTTDYEGSVYKDNGTIPDFYYYGVINGKFNNYSAKFLPTFVKILTVDDIEKEMSESVYPKLMYVSDTEIENSVMIRPVIGEFIKPNGDKVFVAEHGLMSHTYTFWKYVKDIHKEEPKPLELTINDIAKKYNVQPELIKIIK